MSNLLSIQLEDKMFVVSKPFLFSEGVQFKWKKDSLCYECSLQICDDNEIEERLFTSMNPTPFSLKLAPPSGLSLKLLRLKAILWALLFISCLHI